MLSTTTHFDTLAPDEKCLSSTESSDYSDSNSIQGQPSPKQGSILPTNSLDLSPQTADSDLESCFSYTSAEGCATEAGAGKLCRHAADPSSKLRQCPSLFTKMRCELGCDCCYSHGEEDFRGIVSRMRSGHKYFLLEEYPELVLLRASAKNCSALFE